MTTCWPYTELLTEDQIAAREDLKILRKQDRITQKERLEELVPRADPGSRDRKLEKKKEVSTLVASARDTKEGGTEEVDEGDLMGEDGVEGYKKRKREQEKKKSERELRKEELWRVRAEEREERLRVHKEKEDKTMDMFKKLAAQRFGAAWSVIQAGPGRLGIFNLDIFEKSRLDVLKYTSFL